MELHNAIDHLLGRLERCSAAIVSALCLTAILAIGVVDYISGAAIPLALLYLIPILIAAWYASAAVALFLAVIATGTMFVAQTVGTPELGGAGALREVLWQLALFTVLIALVRVLSGRLRAERFRARSDPLTGLLNERACRKRLAREAERSRRYGHPFSLACLDVDNFRAINDAYGRTAGDIVLRRVAATICRYTRSSDMVARLHGDEFVVAFSEAGKPEAARAVANLRSHLHTCLAELRCPVALNIGVVSYSRPPQDVGEILRTAAERRGKTGREQASQSESAA